MENTHRMAARSAWKGSRRSLALAIAWTFLLPGVALALTVTGTVNDSSGNPIPSIRVQVWDEDTNDVIPTGDDLIDTVYTNAAGVYTMNAASGWGPENPDIYVVVDWKFPLTPAASFNNAHMNMIGTTTINTCGADAPILFTSKTSAITTDFAGASLTVPVQNMANALAQGVGNLHLAINRVINYYEDNKGSAGWSLSADVDVKVRLNPPHQSGRLLLLPEQWHHFHRRRGHQRWWRRFRIRYLPRDGPPASPPHAGRSASQWGVLGKS